MALHSTGHAGALALAHEWSSQDPQYRADEVDAKWRSFKRSGGITVGTLYKAAGVPAWRPKAETEFSAIELPEGLPTVQRIESIPSDVDLAAECSAEIGEKALFVGGRWYIWDGQRHATDETGRVLNLVRAFCNRKGYAIRRAWLAAGEKENAADRVKAHIGSAKTIRAVEYLIRVDSTHARLMAELDSDPDIINTRDGIYRFSDGCLLPHSTAAGCTKITGAGVGTHCPTWRRFVDEATGGDVDLGRYLQKVCGYIATGSIREHLFWVLFGRGGTGKSTLIETVAGALGDYAGTADAALFVTGSETAHPTGIAKLHSRRLIVAPELRQGAFWNEELVKRLTGGDRISARFMRGDFFDFDPVCKLVFVGNFKPHLRNVEDGLKRRLILVPFEHKPATEDKDLRAKLRAEWDGILGWILQGARMWREEGLQAPAAVRAATNEYFAAEDDIGRWVAESVEADPAGFVEAADLFASFRQWTTANGGYLGTLKRLSSDLQRRGYRPAKHPRNRRAGFSGIRLVHPYSLPGTIQ